MTCTWYLSAHRKLLISGTFNVKQNQCIMFPTALGGIVFVFVEEDFETLTLFRILEFWHEFEFFKLRQLKIVPNTFPLTNLYSCMHHYHVKVWCADSLTHCNLRSLYYLHVSKQCKPTILLTCQGISLLSIYYSHSRFQGIRPLSMYYSHFQIPGYKTTLHVLLTLQILWYKPPLHVL